MTGPVRQITQEFCPTCEISGHEIGTALGASVFSCPRCTLCFLAKSVRPGSAADNSWYDQMLTYSTADAIQLLSGMRPRFQRQLKLLAQMVPGRRIVDVGCGVGTFLAVAKEAGWEPVGIEESVYGLEFARKHYDIEIHRSFDEIAESSVDVLRASHVLEHLAEPRPFLDAVARLLKPGGILHVLVPNREPLACFVVNSWRRLHSTKPNLAGAIYPDMHVLGFSPKSLRILGEETGFRALSVKSIGIGNRTYLPLLYDGLFGAKKIGDIPGRQLFRYFLPQFASIPGALFGKGEWVVGLFEKRRT